jgi:GT2 family glycosyltransferase
MMSVVVPTYKRPHLLNHCLHALCRQRLDHARYEIILVADGPCEHSRWVARTWTERPGAPEIRYLEVKTRGGPAAARNIGWRAARGTIIAFTDDDCVPSAGWLAAGLDAFADSSVAAVCGRILVPTPAVPTDWERNVAGLEQAPFATANCFYRRQALELIGGFDERFTAAYREDSDLQFRLLTRGLCCASQPSAVVVHPIRPAPWGISLRLQRNNMFNALLYKKHPALYRRLIQARPPLRYYAMVAALMVACAAGFADQPWIAGGALAAWLVLTAEFCRRRLRRTSRRVSHIVEMAVTSALIPPLAVFWRIRGAVKYRVLFL